MTSDTDPDTGPGTALAPRVEIVGTTPPTPSAVVVVLHGGKSRSHEPAGTRRRLTYLRIRPFAIALARAGNHHGVLVWLLRYRYRGWNGPARDAARDARWAVAEAARRHPGVPVVLVGHSMGGRAALHAAGGPGVVAVCALAPWLDGTDPVEQLADRTVLIAHGDRERWTDPGESLAFAIRARRVTPRVARFEILGDGHFLLRRAADWTALVRRFVLGVLGIEPVDPAIANALRRPAPDGLRVPLPTKYATTDTPGRH